jgi:hypothetical protein
MGFGGEKKNNNTKNKSTRIKAKSDASIIQTSRHVKFTAPHIFLPFKFQNICCCCSTFGSHWLPEKTLLLSQLFHFISLTFFSSENLIPTINVSTSAERKSSTTFFWHLLIKFRVFWIVKTTTTTTTVYTREKRSPDIIIFFHSLFSLYLAMISRNLPEELVDQHSGE